MHLPIQDNSLIKQAAIIQPAGLPLLNDNEESKVVVL